MALVVTMFDTRYIKIFFLLLVPIFPEVQMKISQTNQKNSYIEDDHQTHQESSAETDFILAKKPEENKQSSETALIDISSSPNDNAQIQFLILNFMIGVGIGIIFGLIFLATLPDENLEPLGLLF